LLLANIGGVVKAVTICATLISVTFSKHSFFVYIHNLFLSHEGNSNPNNTVEIFNNSQFHQSNIFYILIYVDNFISEKATDSNNLQLPQSNILYNYVEDNTIIITKKDKNLNLSTKELIIPFKCLKNSKRTQYLKESSVFIENVFSIENIFKIFEVHHIKNFSSEIRNLN
jgi:hypothetical protein